MIKQCITEKQWYELCSKEKIKNLAKSLPKYATGYPWMQMSIGGMISVLKDLNGDADLKIYPCLIVELDPNIDEEPSTDGWAVKCNRKNYTENELCDCLWEAVKFLL